MGAGLPTSGDDAASGGGAPRFRKKRAVATATEVRTVTRKSSRLMPMAAHFPIAFCAADELRENIREA